jgi:flagellar basal body-associated protein FliL
MPVSAPISAPLSLPPEPLPERGAVTGSSRRLPAFEQAPEVFDRIERESPGRPAASGGGKERLLIALAAVVVLGLVAWLTYPAWRNRGSELSPAVLRARDEAVALLRRDDAASRELALARLRPVLAQFPKFTEAQAELGVALALQLDDTKLELELIGEQEARLRKEIKDLTTAQAPADWAIRVNAGKAELETLGNQRRTLEASVAELTKQLEESLLIIRAAPPTEPAADVVARLKAQAVHAGVTGSSQALALAERLRKVENPAHWSAISLAEYGLNARSPPSTLAELGQSLQTVREQDNTFIRAYVLGARLALRQQDPATARTLLDTVEALNPNHALARKLRALATSTAAAP